MPDADPGESVKVAFLFDYPRSEDVLENRPLAGRTGQWWLNRILPPGRKREEILISHVLRCRPAAYPTAERRRKAELVCRQYDCVRFAGPKTERGSIERFNPNIFVFTHALKDIPLQPPFLRLIQADIAKAFRFAEQGYRPLVTFGAEASYLIAPWTAKGGYKNWRGGFFEGEWPFLEGQPLAAPPPKRFLAA